MVETGTTTLETHRSASSTATASERSASRARFTVPAGPISLTPGGGEACGETLAANFKSLPPPLGVAGGGVGVNGGVEEGEGGSGGGGLEFGITLSRDGIVEGVNGITETETSGAILGGLFALGDGSRALGEGVGPVGGWRKRIEAEKRALSTDGGSDYDNGEADGTTDPWAPKPN